MLHNAQGQPVGDPLPKWRAPLPPSRVLLSGRYCRLEPLEAQRHGPDLWAAARLDVAGSSWTYLPYGPFDSYEAYAAWLTGIEQESDPLFFAIVDASSAKAV